MSKKVIFLLIVLGVISVGTATYALFNDNILLDVTTDVATNHSSLQNNQSNIQNNQSNNIAKSENLNSSFNNMVNAVLNDSDAVNNDGEEKVVKEVHRVIDNGRTYIFYDDLSHVIIEGNHTWHDSNILKPILDTDSMSGGYIICADCGKFIPIGDVSGLVPEDYLCKCPDEQPKSVKEVTFVYSEENILEAIKMGLKPFSGSPTGYAEIPVDDTSSDGSANIDDGGSNSSSTPDSDRVISKESNPDSDFVPKFYPGDYNPFDPSPTFRTGIIYDDTPLPYKQEPMID